MLPPPPEANPPPDWKEERRTEYMDGSGRHLARPKKVFVSPGGTTVVSSLKEAWRRHRGVAEQEAISGAASPVPSASSVPSLAEDSDEPRVDVRGRVPVRRSARVAGPSLPYEAVAHTLS